jgi:RND family efflux transporter MFP subunit
MNNLIQKLRAKAEKHRVLTSLVAIALAYGGYSLYQYATDDSGITRYVTGTVAKGNIMSTITGTGQVVTADSIDVKPEVSSIVTQLLVKEGDIVTKGQVLARLDATSALKTLRNAETNLESAILSREDALAPLDELTLLQLENSLARAETTKQNAEDTLVKSYDDGFNTISNAFLALPGLVSGLHDLLFTTSGQLGGNNVNNIDYYANTAALFDDRGRVYGEDADAKYQHAQARYNESFARYKTLDRSASRDEIEAMLRETYDTTLAIADAVKSANNLIQFYQDQMTQNGKPIPSPANTQLTTLNSYTGTANSHLTSLLSIQNTIRTNKSTIVDSERSIAETTLSITQKKAGPTVLERRSLDLTVKQREDDLLDAQVNAAKYTVRAPFSGVLAKVSARVGETAGTIATLITKEQVVELSLNEVDAALVAVGQKATITFDALENVALTGKVTRIDTVGTVSSGVVSYAVTIGFDTTHENVRTGMSANVTIVTNMKTDVLTVPASAVKTQSGTNYVLVFDPPLAQTSSGNGTPSELEPTRKEVTVGISDDTTTEVLSGVAEGEQVVTRTIAGASTAAGATTQQSSSAATRALQGGGMGVPRF